MVGSGCVGTWLGEVDRGNSENIGGWHEPFDGCVEHGVGLGVEGRRVVPWGVVRIAVAITGICARSCCKSGP